MNAARIVFVRPLTLGVFVFFLVVAFFTRAYGTEKYPDSVRTLSAGLDADPTLSVLTSLGTTPAVLLAAATGPSAMRYRAVNISTRTTNSGDVCLFYSATADCTEGSRTCSWASTDGGTLLVAGASVYRKPRGNLTLCAVASTAGQSVRAVVTGAL